MSITHTPLFWLAPEPVDRKAQWPKISSSFLVKVKQPILRTTVQAYLGITTKLFSLSGLTVVWLKRIK